MFQLLLHFFLKKKALRPRELAVVTDEGGVRISERVSTTVVDTRRPSEIKDDATRLIDIEKNKVHLHCHHFITSPEKNVDSIFKSIGIRFTEEKLGSGAFGEVVKCVLMSKDGKNPDQELACKIVDASVKTKSRIRDLAREILALKVGKGHKYFIQCPLQFIVDSHVFILMELADRGDLNQYIGKRGALREDRSQRFFIQIAKAIEFLHSKGLAHRDIKPKNILLKNEMDDEFVRRVCKLSDFGLATNCRTESGKVIKFSGVNGTEGFLAPEILEHWADPSHAEKYDARPTDLWALGVVLYNMVTGNYPFNYHDRKTLLNYQKSKTISFYRNQSNDEGRKPLSDNVIHLLRMLLNPNPRSRITFWGIWRHGWVDTLHSASSTKSANQ